jgi:hypothetical protein
MGEVINMAEWGAQRPQTQAPEPAAPALSEAEIERITLRGDLRYCLLRLWTLQEPDLSNASDESREQHNEWFHNLIKWVYSREAPHGKRSL